MRVPEASLIFVGTVFVLLVFLHWVDSLTLRRFPRSTGVEETEAGVHVLTPWGSVTRTNSELVQRLNRRQDDVSSGDQLEICLPKVFCGINSASPHLVTHDNYQFDSLMHGLSKLSEDEDGVIRIASMEKVGSDSESSESDEEYGEIHYTDGYRHGKSMSPKFKTKKPKKGSETKTKENPQSNNSSNGKFNQTDYLERKQRELAQTKDMTAVIQLASEIGHKLKSSRQCRQLFHNCQLTYEQISKLISDSEKQAAEASTTTTVAPQTTEAVTSTTEAPVIEKIEKVTKKKNTLGIGKKSTNKKPQKPEIPKPDSREDSGRSGFSEENLSEEDRDDYVEYLVGTDIKPFQTYSLFNDAKDDDKNDDNGKNDEARVEESYKKYADTFPGTDAEVDFLSKKSSNKKSSNSQIKPTNKSKTRKIKTVKKAEVTESSEEDDDEDEEQDDHPEGPNSDKYSYRSETPYPYGRQPPPYYPYNGPSPIAAPQSPYPPPPSGGNGPYYDPENDNDDEVPSESKSPVALSDNNNSAQSSEEDDSGEADIGSGPPGGDGPPFTHEQTGERAPIPFREGAQQDVQDSNEFQPQSPYHSSPYQAGPYAGNSYPPQGSPVGPPPLGPPGGPQPPVPQNSEEEDEEEDDEPAPLPPPAPASSGSKKTSTYNISNAQNKKNKVEEKTVKPVEEVEAASSEEGSDEVQSDDPAPPPPGSSGPQAGGPPPSMLSRVFSRYSRYPPQGGPGAASGPVPYGQGPPSSGPDFRGEMDDRNDDTENSDEDGVKAEDFEHNARGQPDINAADEEESSEEDQEEDEIETADEGAEAEPEGRDDTIDPEPQRESPPLPEVIIPENENNDESVPTIVTASSERNQPEEAQNNENEPEQAEQTSEPNLPPRSETSSEEENKSEYEEDAKPTPQRNHKQKVGALQKDKLQMVGTVPKSQMAELKPQVPTYTSYYQKIFGKIDDEPENGSLLDDFDKISSTFTTSAQVDQVSDWSGENKSRNKLHTPQRKYTVNKKNNRRKIDFQETDSHLFTNIRTNDKR